MKRVQLLFPNAADVWNFLDLTKMPKAEVEEKTIKGFFTEKEIELACKNFGADVQDYVITAEKDQVAEPVQSHAAAKSTGVAVQLTGKSGTVYMGTLYTKADEVLAPPDHAIICLSHSTLASGVWQHAVNAIYRNDNVTQELEDFKERDDITHLLVLPVNPAEHSVVDKVDDLIRAYLHG